MRIEERRPRALRVTALLVVLALAGCAPTPVPTPATHSATDAPVFASDDAALAAATKAYAAYLTASDSSGAVGSRTRLAYLALTTGDAHEEDLSAEQSFDERGWHKIGATSFDSMTIQSSTPNTKGVWEIRTYLCLDVTNSDVVDGSGRSVAHAGRPLRLPLEVSFIATRKGAPDLYVSESRVWSGSDFC